MGSTHLTWTGIDDPTRIDDCRVEESFRGLRAVGSSITEEYSTAWTLEVGPDWATRRISVTAAGPGWSRHLTLTRSDSGTWSSRTLVEGENDLPEPGIFPGQDLRGAVDCDLGKCPLTNLMPIRRLGLLEGNVPDTELVMAWIDVPSLQVIRSDQIYGSSPNPSSVRYTSRSRDVSVELALDPEGYVLEYPGLAQRA
ncbi:putative glycolipid-binding domain-containing protein [Brachybacterium sp. JHP9]|uniref:Glycolipid-binding domain-containing protein n=1 Tax=Brachybacterium equifaecis TaxID=2910770 RepID=A0ABT0R1M6_9MICO|nr:putative glycolipid-binding domain-containing protein [Brachybacterium equifaecis]MCL6423838.1 putative glycolipid-binding domain-containing protein [Brachybacterium equifaecis]